MMTKTSPRALGKGLSALIEQVNDLDSYSDSRELRDNPEHVFHAQLDSLIPNPNQPRRFFSEKYLEELAESIKENGILQPLIVRKISPNKFQIIAGERRYRAAKLAKLNTAPVLIKNLSDHEAIIFAVLENIQRSDLTPIEEAEGFARIIKECQLSQDEAAKRLGKSRSHLTNCLRLLTLPDSIKEMLHTGAISPGHARTLVGNPNAENLAEQIIKDKLSVREAEALAKKEKPASFTQSNPSGKNHNSKEKDLDLLQIEETLKEQLHLDVSIDYQLQQGRPKGKLTIGFQNLEELDRLIRILTKP